MSFGHSNFKNAFEEITVRKYLNNSGLNFFEKSKTDRHTSRRIKLLEKCAKIAIDIGTER